MALYMLEQFKLEAANGIVVLFCYSADSSHSLSFLEHFKV